MVKRHFKAVDKEDFKKVKRGGTSEGRVENGKMDVWCEVTR